MSKELFTFIMEWNGGTYVSQVEANHIEHAINEWLINLDLEMLSWKGIVKLTWLQDGRAVK